ncbi:MAG: hypothetical protein WBV68_01310, partial [Exiguobacterium oxidotolerans]
FRFEWKRTEMKMCRAAPPCLVSERRASTPLHCATGSRTPAVRYGSDSSWHARQGIRVTCCSS